MTQAKNMFVIEVDFFREDRRFLSLSWSSKIVYIAMWCNAFHERKEMTQWRSRDHLVAQLHLWTDAPMDIVSNAIEECCSCGLTSFDGHVLTVHGVAAKHTTIQRWYNTVDAPLGTDGIGRPIRGKKTSQTGKENTPNLPPIGRQNFPEPEREPEQEPLRAPLPPSEDDEEDGALSAEQARAIVCDALGSGEEGERAREPELVQLLRDLSESYQHKHLGARCRQTILKRRFTFASQKHLAQVAMVSEEKLLPAVVYALREGKDPAGALYEYAVRWPLPRGSEDECHAEAKRALGRGR